MVWMIGLSARAAGPGSSARTHSTNAIPTAVRRLLAVARPGNTNLMTLPNVVAGPFHASNGSQAGPSLVRRAGAGPDHHRAAVGGGVAADVEAQSGLDRADRPVRVEHPLL